MKNHWEKHAKWCRKSWMPSLRTIVFECFRQVMTNYIIYQWKPIELFGYLRFLNNYWLAVHGFVMNAHCSCNSGHWYPPNGGANQPSFPAAEKYAKKKKLPMPPKQETPQKWSVCISLPLVSSLFWKWQIVKCFWTLSVKLSAGLYGAQKVSDHTDEWYSVTARGQQVNQCFSLRVTSRQKQLCTMFWTPQQV